MKNRYEVDISTASQQVIQINQDLNSDMFHEM